MTDQTPEKKTRGPENPTLTRLKMTARAEEMTQDERIELGETLSDGDPMRLVATEDRLAREFFRKRMDVIRLFESIVEKYVTLPPAEQEKFRNALKA